MRIRSIVITLALVALGAGAASAQDSETLPVRQSYQVCDWGLLVIEHPANDGADIEIVSPANNSGVPSSFTITGEAQGIFENQFVVTVSTAEGEELFLEVAVVTTDEMGGRGTWSLDVDLGELPEATPLVIAAFADSPADGSIMAQDIVYVSGNSQFGLPYIDIVVPLSGDVATFPLHVEGTAGALFENSFVLELSDASGNVLAQTPVTFASPDIGLAGPWAADLDATAEPGTRLTVTAYATSMADGETIVASDVATVIVDPFALSYDRTLVLRAGDPVTMDDDICNAVSGELAGDTLTPVTVDRVEAIQTLSMPPQATLIIRWQGPSYCDMPLRLRLVRGGDAYTGTLYYSAIEGDGGICTRDLREHTMSVPLGTQPTGVLTATVNGVPVAPR